MNQFKQITLSLVIFLSGKSFSQNIPYGNNPDAGHYNVLTEQRSIMKYTESKPLVMLHGGVYGYIDEFAPFIPKLAENFEVICIATRGHGKSEMGKDPFTYKQELTTLTSNRSITKDSVVVIIFDGGFSGLKLASLYPELVKINCDESATDQGTGNMKKQITLRKN
jgi:pimeloyl-ACP methyl ester carboxylesterase